MFYAQVKPQGFSNQVHTFGFEEKWLRDHWVCLANEFRLFGENLALAATRAEAMKAINWRGDRLTQSHNSGLRMDAYALIGKKLENKLSRGEIINGVHG